MRITVVLLLVLVVVGSILRDGYKMFTLILWVHVCDGLYDSFKLEFTIILSCNFVEM